METTPRLSRGGALAGLVVAGCGLALAVPVIGPTHWPDSVELLASLVAWWVAAVLLVWLSLSLGLWAIALGRPRLENSLLLRILTVPGSRRLAEGFLAVGMLAACSPSSSQLSAPQIEVLGPAESSASTAAPPSVSITVDTGDLAPVPSPPASVGSLSDTRELVESAPVDPDGPGGTSLGPVALPEVAPLNSDEALPEPPPEDQPAFAATHVVVRGDNLWTISESHLSTRLGRPASAAEITPFWSAVIQANAATLSSGDPDLIFPGEVMILPPID